MLSVEKVGVMLSVEKVGEGPCGRRTLARGVASYGMREERVQMFCILYCNIQNIFL